ncbi:hypothetical protein EVAR_10898_1 [Eumeta japonica]|uniref:Uncharacterized protein n=1 Tax=Eumeta variegata TaxID=151549 RepID=A0A4C1USW6_EUMVA|nr:hypothetical protein EVAR_10898_1 [Eumeta japonica]
MVSMVFSSSGLKTESGSRNEGRQRLEALGVGCDLEKRADIEWVLQPRGNNITPDAVERLHYKIKESGAGKLRTGPASKSSAEPRLLIVIYEKPDRDPRFKGSTRIEIEIGTETGHNDNVNRHEI